MKFAYISFILFITFAPVIGGLLYKKTRWWNFKSTMISLFIMALIFSIWDQIVTGKWWVFNQKFILEIKIGNLPIEEILFFFSIPFACLLIWENLSQFKIKNSQIKNFNPAAMLAFLFICIGVVFLATRMEYSSIVSLILGIMILIDFIFQKLLAQKTTLIFFGIVVILTTIFNNFLTSLPILIYDNAYKTGFLFGTMPIEDVFYGLILIFGNISLYEYMKIKLK
jgi:lycopene cyclase domain-containing protein